MIKVGVIGATGYAGQQLVWFLHHHPNTQLKFLASHSYSEQKFSSIYRNYNGFIQEICIDIDSVEKYIPLVDVIFLALPHGKSFNIVTKALQAGVKVIDLGADFRIKDEKVFSEWYKVEHECPELISNAVYGLPEINKSKIKEAKLIANPGCYPTASILALAPLLKHNLVKKNSIIIDAKSGVSGAGRAAKIDILYAECNESVKAYGVAAHRHTPEIEQELSAVCGDEISITFTPHLIPMNRGILATCYGELNNNISKDEVDRAYNSMYGSEYFIRITEKMPETRWIKNSNFCHIGFEIDKRTGRVIVISAIDNLIKGAAGQAVQNMNLMFGLNETEGLELISMAP